MWARASQSFLCSFNLIPNLRPVSSTLDVITVFARYAVHKLSLLYPLLIVCLWGVLVCCEVGA